MEATGSSTTEEETPPMQEAQPEPEPEKPWHVYIAEDLPRTVAASADTAIRSARSLQQNSSIHFQTLQDSVPKTMSRFRAFEDAFFNRVKDELKGASEHPYLAGGIAVATGLLLMRGPRRFLFRNTLGRLQGEEAKFVRAEKNVKELNLSVALMKKESAKLLERAGLAEKEMKHGHSELINAGTEIQRLAKSVYKVEAQANDLMDGLREISGREALRLRVEVASMASLAQQQRIAMNKRIMKISELGISI